MIRLCLLLSLVICHLSLRGVSHAASPLVLTNAQSEYALVPHLEVLPDPDGRWRLEDVTGVDLSARFTGGMGQTVRVSQLQWFRVNLENRSEQTEWILVLPTAVWDLEVYVMEGPDGSEGASGHVKVEEVDYRHAARTLSLPAGQVSRAFLRIDPRTYWVRLPLTLWKADAFRQSARTEYLYLGLYVGLIAVMVLYNSFLFLSLRDRTYLYYVMFISVVGVWLCNQGGLIVEFGWPGFATPGVVGTHVAAVGVQVGDVEVEHVLAVVALFRDALAVLGVLAARVVQVTRGAGVARPGAALAGLAPEAPEVVFGVAVDEVDTHLPRRVAVAGWRLDRG